MKPIKAFDTFSQRGFYEMIGHLTTELELLLKTRVQDRIGDHIIWNLSVQLQNQAKFI